MDQASRDHALVGTFETSADARQAIRDLRDANVSERHIGVVVRDGRGSPRVRWFADLQKSRAEVGAVAGLFAGAVLGALYALAVVYRLIPGNHALMTMPLDEAIIVCAVVVGVVGAIIGGLVGRGVHDERTAYRRAELMGDRTTIIVQGEPRAELVRTILRGHGSVDEEVLLTETETVGRPFVDTRTPRTV